MTAYLKVHDGLRDADLEAWTAEINDEISRAVTEAEALPPPALETLFTDVYARMPAHIEEQMKYALALGRGTGTRRFRANDDARSVTSRAGRRPRRPVRVNCSSSALLR